MDKVVSIVINNKRYKINDFKVSKGYILYVDGLQDIMLDYVYGTIVFTMLALFFLLYIMLSENIISESLKIVIVITFVLSMILLLRLGYLKLRKTIYFIQRLNSYVNYILKKEEVDINDVINSFPQKYYDYEHTHNKKEVLMEDFKYLLDKKLIYNNINDDNIKDEKSKKVFKLSKKDTKSNKIFFTILSLIIAIVIFIILLNFHKEVLIKYNYYFGIIFIIYFLVAISLIKNIGKSYFVIENNILYFYKKNKIKRKHYILKEKFYVEIVVRGVFRLVAKDKKTIKYNSEIIGLNTFNELIYEIASLTANEKLLTIKKEEKNEPVIVIILKIIVLFAIMILLQLLELKYLS